MGEMDMDDMAGGGFMSMVMMTKDLPRSADGLPMDWLEVPFGPLFPGLPGGLRLRLTLDGDTVVRATVQPGALGRGLEEAWLGPVDGSVDRFAAIDPLKFVRSCDDLGDVLNFEVLHASYQARVAALPGNGEPKLVVFNRGGMLFSSVGVVFDETYLHFAENKTDVDRIILFCDVERPIRFAPARWIVNAIASVLMRAAASPNETGDKTGGINRAFFYLYQVRLVGKRMKAWNRRVYYTFKWSLYAGIALLIFWRDVAALPHLIATTL